VAELYLGYKRQNLPAEIRIYSQGGHGFGMRKKNLPVDGSLNAAAEWI
jgi:hypothetical protein